MKITDNAGDRDFWVIGIYLQEIHFIARTLMIFPGSKAPSPIGLNHLSFLFFKLYQPYSKMRNSEKEEGVRSGTKWRLNTLVHNV